MVDDLFFYGFHRTLHENKWLYRHIRKITIMRTLHVPWITFTFIPSNGWVHSGLFWASWLLRELRVIPYLRTPF